MARIVKDVKASREVAQSFRVQSPELNFIGEVSSIHFFEDNKSASLKMKREKQFFTFKGNFNPNDVQNIASELAKYQKGDKVLVVYKPRQKDLGMVTLHIMGIYPVDENTPKTSTTKFVGTIIAKRVAYDNDFYELDIERNKFDESVKDQIPPYKITVRSDIELDFEIGQKYLCSVDIDNVRIFLDPNKPEDANLTEFGLDDIQKYEWNTVIKLYNIES